MQLILSPSVTLFLLSSFISLSFSHPQTTRPLTSSSQRGQPVRQLTSQNATASNPSIPATGLIPPEGDHPEWAYRNGEWIKDQQDHFRLHCYLSMSVFGDFANTCSKTFPGGFKVLQTFSGGYIARVDQMQKIVIVFKGPGNYDGSMDLTPSSVSSFVSNCTDCMVAAGIKNEYLRLKAETNDFFIAKDAVVRSTDNGGTQMLFSVTGLGWGGAIASLCALDLGARNLVHFSHNQGSPRAFNSAAVIRYDNLFQFLAGQSVVARNDFAVQYVPKGIYTHVGQKVHIFGDKTQWLANCFGNNENATCLGDGSSKTDHTYYFTPLGQCGSADKGF